MNQNLKYHQLSLFILIILWSNSLVAQESTTYHISDNYYGDSGIRTLPLRVSYFGVLLTHPGIKIGSEYPLLKSEKYKIKNEKLKIKTSQLLVSPNFGFYYHKRNQIGIFINAEIAYQKIHYCSFLWEIALGAGYLRTFLPNTTYRVDNQGHVKKVLLAGSNYFMPSFSMAVGKRFVKKSNRHLSLFFRPTIFFYLPYNTNKYPAPNIVFEFCLRYENIFNNPFLKRTDCEEQNYLQND